jgi:tRNA-dihydrouridine synthase B
MAGVTDLPFRQLCRQLGAGMVVSEMLIADSQMWSSRKSSLRMDHTGEAEPIVVQIAGGDAASLAEAARLNVDQGAQIIDINMGCPAKKVCKKVAGSALLKDEPLVAEILEAVVKAVSVPVTLKFRTGWSADNRNAVRIAQLAESLGIQSLALHGRTREDLFTGQAEYDTIAEVVSRVNIPVLANGDIKTPQEAKAVLDYTRAAGVMIGRAAQGRPWIFREITHYLETGEQLAEPPLIEVRELLLSHLDALYGFYGEVMGPRIARKHVSWYLQTMPGSDEFRRKFNALDNASEQQHQIHHYFEQLFILEDQAA